MQWPNQLPQPRQTPVPCAEVPAAIADDRARLAAARGDLQRAILQSNLAMSLYSSYRCSDNWDHLGEAIDQARSASKLLPRAHPFEVVTKSNLAVILGSSREPRLLREAVAVNREILDQLPTLSPNYAPLLAQAGQTAHALYGQTADRADLDEAINLLTRAREATPPSQTHHDVIVVNLATLLVSRGRLARQVADVDRAIELFAGLDHPGAGAEYPSFRSGLRTNFMDAYQARFQLTGDQTDLDRARAMQREVDAAGQHETLYADATQTDTAATAALDAFNLTGDLTELDKAIAHQHDVVAKTRLDGQAQSIALTNLGISYLARYRSHRGARAEDLTRATDLIREARELATLPQDRAQILANLSVCRLEAARPASDPGQPPELTPERRSAMAEGYDLAQEAARLAPADGPAREAANAALSHAHGLRAVYYQGVEDIDRSSAFFEELRHTARPGSPMAADVAATRADKRMARAARTQSEADRAAARAALAELAAEPAAGPSLILEIFNGWGAISWREDRMVDAGESYWQSARALHRLVAAQLGRDDKQSWLLQTRTVTTRATYALAKAGHYDDAMVAFESGRAMILSEALERDRAAVDQLAKQAPELATEFRRAAAAITRLEVAHVNAGGGQVPGDPDGIASARDAYERVLTQIRTVPGFGQFLLLPDARSLRQGVSALAEPVVLIVTTERGGLALVVPEQADEPVRPVWLDRLTLDAEAMMVGAYLRSAAVPQSDRERFTRAQRRIDDVTTWLWETVMGPVVEALGRTKRAALIPAGLLGSAPLHAAGFPDEQSAFGWRYALDSVTFSYGPNIRALVAAHERVPAMVGALLAVAEPAAAGETPLPGAAAEVDAIRGHFSSVSVLRGAAATRAAVRAELPRSSVQHYACHAQADKDFPLESGLLLADGTLTLRDLFGLKLSRTRLAVLSACESAVWGAELPDEVISLPTGLIQAGVPGVVATLWEVPDRASATLMARFYQLWRHGGKQPRDAFRRAQHWLRTTTNGQKLEAFPQAGFVQPRLPRRMIGDWSMRRDHEHPSIWAAFVYLGR